ncbi:MAG: T9SS type A sorting domain-containing protein [Janthinobacterium lividum]
MKRTTTLSLTGALALAGLGAQAQTITVDGTLNAAEISSTGYQLAGTYTGNHGFGNAGLLSMYVAADANKVYVFLAGTLETASDNTVRNSLQLYFGRPGVTTGVATGVALPKPTSSTPITSFDQVISKNDFPVDFAIGVKGTTTAAQAQVDGAVYTGGNSPSAVSQPVYTGLNVTNGAATTVATTGAYTLFNNAVVAFKNSTSLASNPGAPTGGAGSTGLEISFSRSSLNIPASGGPLYVFGLQNNADGDYFSSDIIPQNTGSAPSADPNNGNLQRGPDFTAIPGLQYALLQLSATGGVLGNKAAAAAQVFGAYPNPVAAGSAVQVQLTQPAARATYTLRNVLGQVLQTRTFAGTAASLATGGLPAGTYLLTVEAGSAPVTSRVQVL